MFKKLTSLFGNAEKSEKQTGKGKKEVSEVSVNLHNQAFNELKLLGRIAKTMDIPAFNSPDFLEYLEVYSLFVTNKDNYQGLKQSAKLLNVAVQAQASFLKIEQTELRYRSTKQQEYYSFVMDLLSEKFAEEKDNNDNSGEYTVAKKPKDSKNYSPEEFKREVRNKLTQIKPTVKSEEGKQALEDYTDSLEILAKEEELGLKLLYLFKKFNLTDFSVLKVISDIVNYLQDKNLKNIKAMQDLVNKNQELFLKVGQIIGIPKNKENVETYALILQFLALSKKHEKSSTQFFRLLDLLRQWQGFYATVKNLREEYPVSEYNVPDEFTKEIPGVSVYEKYGNYLNVF